MRLPRKQLIVPLLRAYWTVRSCLMSLFASVLMRFQSHDPIIVSNYRRPQNEEDLRDWLTNMIGFHRFSIGEVQAATGLSRISISKVLSNPPISPAAAIQMKHSGVKVLPYPGGRHPRIGFHNGAVNPQRETKVSIFTPWDDAIYIVADVPEAIWSNLGLLYLAHSHVKTVWTTQGIALNRLEWNQDQVGVLQMQRTLPNNIAFGTRVWSSDDVLWFEQWLSNGANQKLSSLRVQNCILLKGAQGFDRQTNANKHFWSPYIACHSNRRDRWIIAAWTPNSRVWANPYCPCMHSDPKFDDCLPGQTQHIYGRLSFYRGTNVESEFRRIEATGWRN